MAKAALPFLLMLLCLLFGLSYLCASFPPKSINHFLLSPLSLSILNLMINLLNYTVTNIFGSLVSLAFLLTLSKKSYFLDSAVILFCFCTWVFISYWKKKKNLTLLNSVATKYSCPSALAGPKNWSSVILHGLVKLFFHFS